MVSAVSISVASMIYIPSLWKGLLSCILLLSTMVEALKFILGLGFKDSTRPTTPSVVPFISIHLATYNEPPELVIKTVKALTLLDYAYFEIIIVDNNTKDSRLWSPVQEFCRNIPNIRFFHLERWPFYKSGALNFARKVTAAEAEFIFVVDADYVLCPDALRQAAENIGNHGIGLVQFPQAYICQERKHLPIMGEFDHFFDYYCFKANSCYGALATGTLSLIRIAALDAVGGWPRNSITEDAELGVRLQSSGYDINYVHRIIGKGLVPIRQKDFLQQRKRWIFGNIQTLLRFSVSPFKNFAKWLSGISQLTAWINFLGIPIIGLACSLMASPWLSNGEYRALLLLCYSALWLYIISKSVQFYFAQSSGPKEIVQALLVHFAVLDIAAFHWWPVLFGKKIPFEKTDKTGKGNGYRINLFYPMLHGLILLSSAIASNWGIAMFALFFTSLHIAAIYTDFGCRANGWKNVTYSLKLQL